MCTFIRYIELHPNSRFRDIGRCFRLSLRPLLAPIAPYDHVTCASLSVIPLFETSSKKDQVPKTHPPQTTKTPSRVP